MIETYTPLFSEILDKVSKAKTKSGKINVLKQYNTPALRIVIKASFDPNIEWLLPRGLVPYQPNEAPEGTEHSILAREAKKLYHFVKGGDNTIGRNKREAMFIQMLEGLHINEAELLIAAKDKILHQKYKGLSDNVVKEAFDWNDDYKLDDHASYPQAPGMASGPG